MSLAARGVLVDFAGTLFEPEPSRAWVEAGLARLDNPLPPLQLDALVAACVAAGRPGPVAPLQVPDALARVFAERDLDPPRHRRAYTGLLAQVEHDHRLPGLAAALYERAIDPAAWLPILGSREALALLASRCIPVAVVSNVAFDVRRVFDRHGFSPVVSAFTLSYEHHVMKPDARLFAEACRALNLSAADVVMIGDDPMADGGAVHAGICTVLLPRVASGADNGLLGLARLLAGPDPTPGAPTAGAQGSPGA